MDPQSESQPAGNGAAPESMPSIDEIVDGFDFGEGEATDGAPAADPASSSTETPAAADSSTPGTNDAEKPAGEGTEGQPQDQGKPQLYTAEELRKFSWRDVQRPDFDWSRVPPEVAEHLKAVQAVHTRGLQELKKLQTEGTKQTPSESSQEDPAEKENAEIVERALRRQGLDPEEIKAVMEERRNLAVIDAVAQKIPEYVSDEKFQEAVNLAVVNDETLFRLAESNDPTQMTAALETAALRVQNTTLRAQQKSLADREAAVKTREAELTAALENVRLQQEALNREPGSAAAGRTQAGQSPRNSTSVEDIIDDAWPSGETSLI